MEDLREMKRKTSVAEILEKSTVSCDTKVMGRFGNPY
jgi:hypothetical protein